MEPITTTTALGIALWEYLGKPIVDKVKDKYSEQMLDLALSILKDDDKKVIKTELSKCDENILTNEVNFLKFINENINIQNLLKENPIIIRSLTDIEDSKIYIDSQNPSIIDSLNHIKNSEIKVGKNA
jgi:hypothetical protein